VTATARNGLLALAVGAALAPGALAREKPSVELKPIRKIWVLDAGACSVDVTFRLEVKDAGDERYYCPEIEWEWEDGTRSIEESDCPPFEEAEKDRRFVRRKTHAIARSGQWTITVRLSKAGELIHEEDAQVVVAGYEGMSDNERAQHCR